MAIERSDRFKDAETAKRFREARIAAFKSEREQRDFSLTAETFKGLPRAAGEISKDIGQSVARSFLAIGQKLHDRDIGAEFVPREDSRLQQALTGGQSASFTSIGKDIRGADPDSPTRWFDPVVGAGIAALDVSPFGAGRQGIGQSFKQIAQTQNRKVIESVLQKDLGFKKTVANRLSAELVESASPRAVGETIARVQQLEVRPTIASLREAAEKSTTQMGFRRNIKGQNVYRVVNRPAEIANVRSGKFQSLGQEGWNNKITELFKGTEDVSKSRFVVEGKLLDNGLIVPLRVSDAQTGRLLNDLTEQLLKNLGAKTLADERLTVFRSNLRKRLPKLSKGDKTLANIALKMDSDDVKTAIDFIDNTRLRKTENVNLEINARRMAEAMGMNPNKTNAALANDFDKLLTVARFGGGSRTAQQGVESSFGAFAGVTTDEEGNIQFNPALAAAGIAGTTAASRATRRPDGSLPETIYIANRAARVNRGAAQAIRKRGGKFGRAIVDWKDGKRSGFFGKAIRPLSSRLRDIDPSLKRAMRGFEFRLVQQVRKDDQAMKGFMDGYTKMPKVDRADLDLAMKNSDMKRVNQIAKKHGMEKDIKKLRGVLDGVHKRAQKSGYELGYFKDYFPRVVSDPEGLVKALRGTDDWSLIQEAIEAKQAVVKRVLTDDEVVNIVNTTLRGFGSGTIKGAKPANFKTRKIDVIDSELNEFYEDSGQAILQYVQRVNEAIEMKRFFGKSLKQAKEGSTFLDIDSSVGAYTTRLLSRGKITPAQEKELQDILRARFDQRYIGQLMGAYKNASYIATMGSPISAITQLGDLAFAMQVGGVTNTVKGIGKTLAGKTYFTKKDLGIERITQEFMDKSAGANLVNRVFRMVGLEALDKLGKNTIANSVLDSYMQSARTGRWKQGQRERLMEFLGRERGVRAIEDLRNGKMTDDVKFVAFNELLDIQPVAASEMPEYYLRGGNARVLYMLKSFTIKQWDFMRERILTNPHTTSAEKARNMLTFAVFFMGANATADEIKDWMLGRETSLGDRTIDNVARLAGLSKWAVWQARDEGLTKAAFGQFVIPPDLLADPISDSFKAATGRVEDVTDIETPKNIPVGGKLWYWWFGRGSLKPGGRLNPEGERTLRARPESSLDLGLDLESGAGSLDLELGI